MDETNILHILINNFGSLKNSVDNFEIAHKACSITVSKVQFPQKWCRRMLWLWCAECFIRDLC